MESWRVITTLCILCCALCRATVSKTNQSSGTGLTADLTDTQTLWFLLDTVLSSFTVHEKNDQGYGVWSVPVNCPPDTSEKVYGGKRVCVPISDDD